MCVFVCAYRCVEACLSVFTFNLLDSFLCKNSVTPDPCQAGLFAAAAVITPPVHLLMIFF